MNFISRAWLYMIRKKGKSILLFVVLLIMATFIHTIPQWRTESYRTKENKRKTLGAHRSGSFSALAFGALTGLAASTENSSGWIACSKSRKLRCISRLMK